MCSLHSTIVGMPHCNFRPRYGLRMVSFLHSTIVGMPHCNHVAAHLMTHQPKPPLHYCRHAPLQPQKIPHLKGVYSIDQDVFVRNSFFAHYKRRVAKWSCIERFSRRKNLVDVVLNQRYALAKRPVWRY